MEGEKGKQTSAAPQAEREAQWHERLARHAASGRIEASCRAEGVAPWSFYHWRKQLAAVTHENAPLASAPFIDLGTMPVEQAAAPAATSKPGSDSTSCISLRIDLGGGIVLHLTRT